jgi:hypothetical protein
LASADAPRGPAATDTDIPDKADADMFYRHVAGDAGVSR